MPRLHRADGRQVGLELHPEKTRIVYCRTGRPATGTRMSRRSRSSGSRSVQTRTAAGRELKSRFLPAISKQAMKIQGRGHPELAAGPVDRDDIREIAKMINPVVAGWIN